MQTKQIIIPEIIQEEAIACLRGKALEDLEAVGMFDEEIGRLWLQLKTNIYAEKTVSKSKKVAFEYPATWWQCFKVEVMPRWFQEMFPVRYKMHERTIKFEQLAAFPKLGLILKNGENAFVIKERME